MSLAAKIAGLTLAIAFMASPSFAQNARQGDGPYRNDPIRAGERCWTTTDNTRGYGRWGDCPRPQASRKGARTAARSAPAAYAHADSTGYRSGHAGPTRVGENCWISTDHSRGYGRWGACASRR